MTGTGARAGAAAAAACMVLAARSAHGAPPEKLAPPVLLVRNATVWTQGPDGRIDNADLLVQDGKIVAVGRGLDAPANAHVVDASGRHVTPGLIDCHSHMAIRGEVNEGSDNITAEVRVSDAIDPADPNIYRALAGGLTAAHLLHGSANSIGGQSAVVKLRRDSTREAMLVDFAPPGIKFALGENPKRSNYRLPERFPVTRMGVIGSIRGSFLAARDYLREWGEYEALPSDEQERREPPRRDLRLDAIGEILEGSRWVHSHCYRQDEIVALMRLVEEFGIRVATFQHVLEGYKVADEIAAHGAGASTFSDWWAYKLEAFDAIPYNGALMRERGVLVSFNSDSAELARRMNLEAAKAIRYGGLGPEEALDLVTRNPARQLGVDHRVGSLEPGKDADLVIWSGDPLSVYSVVEQTWVDGVREFDRGEDLSLRNSIEEERAARIARIRGGGDENHRRADEQAPVAEKTSGPALASNASAAVLDYRDRLATTGEAVSIVHATVHTLAGGVVRNATVSFREGRIVEVGRRLKPLPGAVEIDATGLHVYPGMIAAGTVLGLTEIASVPGSVDVEEIGDVSPEINPAIAVNPDSELIPVTRSAGLTHALTVPTGGLVSGTSALLRLSGWTWEDLVAATPVALHVRWPSFQIRRSSASGPPPSSPEDQREEREKQIRTIRRTFEDARAYARARAAGSSPVDVDPVLEALLPALDGRLPVIVHASEIRQIRSAIAWAETEGVRLILAGAGDLWRVADLLKDKDIPVIVQSVLRLPERDDEPYDSAFALPAKLHAAGVRFCIATRGGTFDAPHTRDLPQHAAMAAAFGLPREEALKAITLYPARILGVGDVLGSIEPGKSASLILADGDPLEIHTRVVAEYIDGRRVPLDDNRHERLYQKYRKRPRVETSDPSER